MTVSIVVSRTLDGAQMSDSLQGGGTGMDIGQVGTGSWTPLTNKSANQGHQDFYIQHDGTAEITSCKIFIQVYGTGTGFSYGGGDSAINDFAAMKAMGNVSGGSKNNNDGNSGGLWVDMDWNASDATAFDQANFPAFVKIFGDNNTDGIDLGSAFTIIKEAMVYKNGLVEDEPSAPVDGTIGPASTPTVIGDTAHLKLRQYLRNDFGSAGYFQYETVIAYSATA